MLIEDLLPNVNLESQYIEFKGILNEGENPDQPGERFEMGWLKEIVAFANSEGGTIYVGVDNRTHQILALDHLTADRQSLMIQRLIKAHIEPPIRYQISSIIVPETKPSRYLLRIEISKAAFPPISMHFNGVSSIYLRHFGRVSAATGEEIRNLVMNSEACSFDDLPTDISYDPKDFTFLLDYYQKHNEGQTLSEKALVSIGFMSRDKFLSKGALLFKDDANENRLRVSCTQFLGFSKGVDTYSYSMDLQENLLKEYEDIKQFILTRSNNGFIKQADTRVPLLSYPERSLTESIINALGHRNYFIEGGQTEVNLYKDRLEFISPGSLVGSGWLDHEKNLSAILPSRRNSVICAVFSLCRLMEEKGSGFDKIEKDYSSYGEKYKPYASSDNRSFSLTLPDLSYQEESFGGTDLPEIHTNIALPGTHDNFILSYCYSTQRSAKEIADKLGIKPSTYFRKELLRKLVDDGFLVERKEGKITYYRSNHSKVLLGNN